VRAGLPWRSGVTSADGHAPGAQGLVVVDYTHPSAVHTNAQVCACTRRAPWLHATRPAGGLTRQAWLHRARQFYAQHAVPFVMGTTGGDRAKLVRREHDVCLG
jgi:hypothetical protein